MNKADQHINVNKFSFAGLLVALGFVFGSIGTSPLYTIKAIITGGAENFNELLIYGSLSCIFWTMTIETTVKYILITIRTDNKGEGGIFALFALLQNKTTWTALLTMIGGAALLANGVITPAITVTSSVEGLKLFNSDIHIIPIVIVIFATIFFTQQFGTKLAGKAFGPVMMIWFLMIGILGFSQFIQQPDILRALNPLFAVRFLGEYPGGFVLLGAIFLCTAGAEALYSDMGYCGKANVKISWIFVKTTILLSYFGQGAWLLKYYTPGVEVNPFFAIMPEWFLLPGIVISICAAIIASQALVSGTFSLVREAVSLNFWPKIRILNPTLVRRQVYLPFINWSLWIMCSIIVLCCKESSNMVAACGLAVVLTVMMTTLLLLCYLYQKRNTSRFISTLLWSILLIETIFLISILCNSNIGSWFILFLTTDFFLIMLGWYFGRKIKNKHISFINLSDYIRLFKDLKQDTTVPRIATNLVYIIKANNPEQVESKVIYSIFNKRPKRADTYWLLHIDRVDEPDRFEYVVTHIIPGVLIRVDFHIGYKVEPKINFYFKEVLEDLVKSGEIKLESSYESLKKHGFPGDFKFVLISRIMPQDYILSKTENFILFLRNLTDYLSISEVKALQLDSTNTIIEKVPIVFEQPVQNRISREK